MTQLVGSSPRGAPAREYWSEQDGIIRIDLLRPDGELSGYYALGSRNFD